MSVVRVHGARIWAVLLGLVLLLAGWKALSQTDHDSPSPPPPPPASTRPPLSRTLVVAALHDTDTSWVDEVCAADAQLVPAVYVVDAPAGNAVPANKGHEVMVYLTYIIENYFSLRDVTVFMHGDRVTWHNNDLLGMDSATMVQLLRGEAVIERGYANLRCQHDPGCPAQVRLDQDGEGDTQVPEAVLIAESWGELFPTDAMPAVLAQPCCGQFAVSAEAIRRVPLLEFVAWRRWLLDTGYDDLLSGRVWEYLWQWVFAGQAVDCPDARVCYCRLYGVCLEHRLYDEWFHVQDEARGIEAQIRQFSPLDDREAMQAQVDALHARMREIRDAAGDSVEGLYGGSS